MKSKVRSQKGRLQAKVAMNSIGPFESAVATLRDYFERLLAVEEK